jgi:hypothetical protein
MMIQTSKLISDANRGIINIPAILHKIIDGGELSESYVKEALSFISMKAEISGKLFVNYGIDDLKGIGELCSADALLMAARCLSIGLKNTRAVNENEVKLKWINAVYKLVDRALESSQTYDTDVHEIIAGLALPSVKSLRMVEIAKVDGNKYSSTQQNSAIQTLPITVLHWEGPMARAYLSTFIHSGFKPKRIINLVSSSDINSGRPLMSSMPKFIRNKYCGLVQKTRAHYWSRYIYKNYPEYYSNLRRAVIESLDFNESCFDDSQSLIPLSEYCNEVRDILITDFNDDNLHTALMEEDGLILYTGGGIVPSSLLAIPGIKFLHVHPGKLPFFKGADCILWSWLIAKKPSATLFFLAPGIDDGDVIEICDFPHQKIAFQYAKIELKQVYRGLYAFYDPWIRAATLREGLFKTDGFRQIVSSRQDKVGMMYHFMSPRLQTCAYENIFNVS